MTFGEKLLFLRKQKKYTQEFVAKHLGIAKSTYCGYEIDNREPSLEKIKCLSELFNVPPAFLLGTGVFISWDQIQQHKGLIIQLLKQWFKNTFFLQYDLNDDIIFINFIDILVEKINFKGKEITVCPRINPKDCNFANYSTIPAENDKDDANKQKLMNNYDVLNNEGQQDLVEYSDMLAGNPRKLKESDKTVPVEA